MRAFDSGVILTKICHLCAQNGRQRVQLINQDQISERARGEEKGIALFQRHGRRKFRLLVVIAQMSNLVQITKMKIN